MNISLPIEPLLEQWINRILTLDKEAPGFKSLTPFKDQLASPFQESKAGLGMFIQDEPNPHYLPDTARWAVLASKPGGMDLLYCEYLWQGQQIRLYESANIIVLRVEHNWQGSSVEQTIKSLVAGIVRTHSEDHNWFFAYPPDLQSNWRGRLISNRGAPAVSEIFGRHDRADILILSETVMFIFYKKIEQLEDFRPDDAWFSPSARALIHASH